MRTSMNRTSRPSAPGRQPALAGLLLVAGLGIALIFGGCGGRNGQSTPNANNPGASQTTGVQNGGPSTGGNAGTSASSSNSLQNLNNSINSSASSLNNDQNDANTSAAQSQEGEQQP